jgi:dihydroorotase
MPNTSPPITTIAQVQEYLREIRRASNNSPLFKPLGVAYINESLDPDELKRGFEAKAWVAAKLYPRGGTTGSENAAESLHAINHLLEVMQEIGMPLLIHGEVVGSRGREFSRWEREAIFVRGRLSILQTDFPRLKKVLEHVSTEIGIESVRNDESGYLAATITPHHALFIDAQVSDKGVHTHANCMPIIKGGEDRHAIQQAMISGDARFFAGTDSAPHDVSTKHSACCSFGAFVAPGALEAYAAVFDQNNVFECSDGVERFEKFMSLNGPRFYELPPAPDRITMIRNTHAQKITERFVIPGRKLLEPSREIISLFHEDLGLAPDFPWIEGIVKIQGEDL